MAKVTNTGAAPLYLGNVQIQPHATVEVSDDIIAKAKEAKIVQEWFANGTLKTGDAAEQDEHDKQHAAGTPASSAPASGGAHTQVEEDDEKPKK